jgi:hypothetical protein
MRTNSGKGKSKNNLHDPTLRDHERAKGVSGEAIHGEKQMNAEPDRKPSREESPTG